MLGHDSLVSFARLGVELESHLLKQRQAHEKEDLLLMREDILWKASRRKIGDSLKNAWANQMVAMQGTRLFANTASAENDSSGGGDGKSGSKSGESTGSPAGGGGNRPDGGAVGDGGGW